MLFGAPFISTYYDNFEFNKASVVTGLMNEMTTNKFEISIKVTDDTSGDNLTYHIKNIDAFHKLVIWKADSLQPGHLFIVTFFYGRKSCQTARHAW